METAVMILFTLCFIVLWSYVTYREILYCKKLLAETKFFNAAADEMRKFD